MMKIEAHREFVSPVDLVKQNISHLPKRSQGREEDFASLPRVPVGVSAS